jgi:hypothetical protein
MALLSLHASHKVRIPGVLDILAVSTASCGVYLHMWVGVMEEGQPVFRPVGHATILAVFAWLVAAVVSGTALKKSRGRSPYAGLGLGVSLVGIALLLSA